MPLNRRVANMGNTFRDDQTCNAHCPPPPIINQPTYLPTNLPTHLHTYLPTNLPTYLTTYQPTYLPIYLPT